MNDLNDIKVSDGDIVAPALIPRALTAGELVFSDHATQVFEAMVGPRTSKAVVRPGVSGT
jgi:hypothetical protein